MNLDDQIAALGGEIAQRGTKRAPMTTQQALRQLAKSADSERTRELARKKLKQLEPVLNVGRRLARADPEAMGPRYFDKAARRMHRRRAIRAASYIERAIDAVRKRNNDTRAMASNSHEARRVIEEDRKLGRARRTA